MIGIIGRPDSLIAARIAALMPVKWLEVGDQCDEELTGLVYVASLNSHDSVMTVTRHQLSPCFETDVVGLVRAIQDLKLAKGAGIVVLNSAFVGRKHTGYGIAYCIAKAAQRQVILNASVQLGEQGKFIVGVAPAFIDTKPTKKMNTDEAYRARVLAQMSVPTFGTADEVARFVRHLLIDGRYHNGATLDMSGGWAL